MGYMNEYLKRGLHLSSAELEKELLKLIKQYNKKRNTYLLVYSSALNKPTPDVALNMEDYYIIYDFIKNNPSSKLDFYIETPGGSGETAEEIVRFLRDNFEEVFFVVSGEAKSAGTLMVLSGNDILMTDSGSLGPIDAQMRIGRSVNSAADYMEWIDKTRKEAKEKGKLNPFDATMVAQISPGELTGVSHAFHFAKDLVTKWLPQYKFKDWNQTETRKEKVSPEMKKRQAEKIVDALLDRKRWRSHGRSIKIPDLLEIGLQINRIDEDRELAEIVYRIQTVIRLLYSSSGTYKIFATAEEKLSKQAAKVGSVAQKLSIPEEKPDLVKLEVKCPQCGKKYKIYAKFIADPRIDKDFKAKDFLEFPKDNMLKCNKCSYELNLTGLRNDIETKIGKKIK